MVVLSSGFLCGFFSWSFFFLPLWFSFFFCLFSFSFWASFPGRGGLCSFFSFSFLLAHHWDFLLFCPPVFFLFFFFFFLPRRAGPFFMVFPYSVYGFGFSFFFSFSSRFSSSFFFFFFALSFFGFWVFFFFGVFGGFSFFFPFSLFLPHSECLTCLVLDSRRVGQAKTGKSREEKNFLSLFLFFLFSSPPFGAQFAEDNLGARSSTERRRGFSLPPLLRLYGPDGRDSIGARYRRKEIEKNRAPPFPFSPPPSSPPPLSDSFRRG